MNQNAMIIFIILLTAALSVGITYLAVKLKSKGTDGAATLEKIGTGLTYAQSVADAISPFLPKIADGIISEVLTVANKAVQHVEATYKAAISTSPNAADTRKAEAISLIKSALALDGIADTPEIDKLIDVIIPLLVLVLPKTHTEKAQAANIAPTAKAPAKASTNNIVNSFQVK